MRVHCISLGVAGFLAAVLNFGCGGGVPPVNEVVAFSADEIPAEPLASGWANVPVFTAVLRPQDLVDPRLMTASTDRLRVQALTNGVEIAFRLEWDDPAQDDRPGPSRFPDGCAVQIPRQIQAAAPDPQMGHLDAPVDIIFWRADWQASMAGRGDSIRDLYPNAAIDHYPFEAPSLEPGSAAQQEMMKRYAPADSVGNRRTGPRESAVEALTAEGPGTLLANQELAAAGSGQRTGSGWAVVIRRPLPGGLTPETRGQIAFAVWNGSHGEVGSRKMITGWNPLAMRGQ